MAAVASRYARALVEVVLEQHIDGDTAREQLRAMVGAVHESLELRRVWESPAVLPEQKRAVLEASPDRLERSSRFAISWRYSSIIAALRCWTISSRQFETELDAQLGFAEAEISSARPLSAEEKRELETRVEHMTGKKIRATMSPIPICWAE